MEVKIKIEIEKRKNKRWGWLGDLFWRNKDWTGLDCGRKERRRRRKFYTIMAYQKREVVKGGEKEKKEKKNSKVVWKKKKKKNFQKENFLPCFFFSDRKKYKTFPPPLDLHQDPPPTHLRLIPRVQVSYNSPPLLKTLPKARV